MPYTNGISNKGTFNVSLPVTFVKNSMRAPIPLATTVASPPWKTSDSSKGGSKTLSVILSWRLKDRNEKSRLPNVVQFLQDSKVELLKGIKLWLGSRLWFKSKVFTSAVDVVVGSGTRYVAMLLVIVGVASGSSCRGWRLLWGRKAWLSRVWYMSTFSESKDVSHEACTVSITTTELLWPVVTLCTLHTVSTWCCTGAGLGDALT
jgi:hypothetical protein